MIEPPPYIQDYLPEDHMARFVVDIIDQLDLRTLSAVYAGKGKRPYHPAMLLALLFYGVNQRAKVTTFSVRFHKFSQK